MRRLFLTLAAALLVAAQADPASAKRPRAGGSSTPASGSPSGAAAATASPEAPAPASATPQASPARSTGRRGGSSAAGAVPGGARQAVQRESHIEFDERLVQGQTAAGAIYLFQRGESEFRSMVRMPESFRDRSVRPILPSNHAPAEKR